MMSVRMKNWPVKPLLITTSLVAQKILKVIGITAHQEHVITRFIMGDHYEQARSKETP
jgi:hypothetical protein